LVEAVTPNSGRLLQSIGISSLLLHSPKIIGAVLSGDGYPCRNCPFVHTFRFLCAVLQNQVQHPIRKARVAHVVLVKQFRDTFTNLLSQVIGHCLILLASKADTVAAFPAHQLSPAMEALAASDRLHPYKPIHTRKRLAVLAPPLAIGHRAPRFRRWRLGRRALPQ
jgi:hypothetical protein